MGAKLNRNLRLLCNLLLLPFFNQLAMLAAPMLTPLAYAPTVMPTGVRSSVKMSFADDFTTDPKPWTSGEISDKAGLEELAKKLNPVVGYWDPLGIGDTSKETIGWFRQAEIKHSRVAMAAFVGYCVQANGIHLPGNLQAPFGATLQDVATISYADISAAGGPSDQWDALPTPAKLQILGFIGFLEMWSETSAALKMDGQEHYVRGGKPGYFPKFGDKFPHPVPLDLSDPFGLQSKMSPERKEKALLAEINNGRLAMIGIFGLISASKGLQVPILDGLGIPAYSGEPMAPFAAGDVSLPYVTEMLKSIGTYGY